MMAEKYKSVKILSAFEVEEKMELGLCLLCDEIFTRDHASKHKRIRFKVVEMDEEGDNDFNHHIPAPFSCPPKSLLHSDSTTVFSNSTLSDDCTKKAQLEEKVVADSNLEMNTEMKSLDHDSSFLNYSSAVPRLSLQVFNHMPTMQQLKSTSLNQKPTMTGTIPLSKGKNQTFQSAQQHSSPSNLQLLSKVKIKPLSSNTIDVSAQSISLNLNKLKCFDPGGMISLLFPPISSVFISVQFPSTMSLPIPPEPPDWVAVQSSSLNFSLLVTTAKHFSMLQSSLQLFDEMPKGHIAVWSVIINRCMDNEQAVEFDLSKGINRMCIMPSHYTLFNMLSLYYWEFWYFGRHAHYEAEVTMNFILELKVRKHPDNYEDDFNINEYGCCLYRMSGTLPCDRCPATNHSRCIGVMDSWFLHNNCEFCLLILEDLKGKHKPIYYSPHNAYSRVFQEWHMLGDSRNCFELSCVGRICMRTDVRHKKSHNQIGWKWKKVSSVLFLKQMSPIIIFHREMIMPKESNGLISTLILEANGVVNFNDKFLNISIFIPNQEAYHDKSQPYWKITPITFTSDMKMLPLECCDLSFGNWGLNSLSSVLHNFSKLQMDFLIFGKKFVLRGVKPLVSKLIHISYAQAIPHSVQLCCVYMDSFNNNSELPTCNIHMVIEMQHVHTWSCLNGFFYDECSSIMAKSHCYFGDRADGRCVYCVSKVGGNEIGLLCFEIMRIHFGHPKLTLELLTKSSHMIIHQLCVLLCGPLGRKKNLQALKLLNSTSLVMLKFNLKQDESAIFFVCLKHCMKINTFLVKICYALEMLQYIKGDTIYRKALLFAYLKLHCFEAAYYEVHKWLILQRKMIYKGSFHAPKVLTNLKDWQPKNGSRKVATNVSFVVAILHRKMINRGNVRDAKVLSKWKVLPLKHGTCDCSSLRTRMFEGEGIVMGNKYHELSSLF
ncbi:unnamed protein product [Trifolium pratense]|uniref:Uncharacterized protein n=1 Tax=Trifolium pratense TaxID=57577 RepID=A0ACB0ILA5_TRIPR|nr:unnamed protein product [Trifolium pratense]